MIITKSLVTHLNISGVDSLDTIDIYLEDLGPGRGRITLQCYGDAWTGYWGAMGDSDIRDFFIIAGPDYLTSKLLGPQQKTAPKKFMKSHEAYLERIVRAVQGALLIQRGRDLAGAGVDTKIL